jgi:hypothetical protein
MNQSSNQSILQEDLDKKERENQSYKEKEGIRKS